MPERIESPPSGRSPVELVLAIAIGTIVVLAAIQYLVAPLVGRWEATPTPAEGQVWQLTTHIALAAWLYGVLIAVAVGLALLAEAL